jgi:hypothetical protein
MSFVRVITCVLIGIGTFLAFEAIWHRSPQGGPISQDYWIAWGTPTGGTGTAASPYKVNSPRDFDKIMNNTQVIVPGTKVHLFPGTFLTQQGLRLPIGASLTGSGIDLTVIKLVDNSGISANDSIIKSADYMSSSSNVVTDLTVDCNLAGQSVKHATQAVALWGGQTRIARVKAINWGATAPLECFVLTIWCNPPILATNCVIEDCIVTQPESRVTHIGMTSAIDILGYQGNHLTPGPGWIWNAVIRNCSVYGVHAGSQGNPPVFHGYGMADVVGGRIEHNFAYDLQCTPGGQANAFAVYDEGGSHLGYIISDNVFMDVEAGVRMNPAEGYVRKNYIIRDNLIALGTQGHWPSHCVEVYGTATGHVQHAVIQDNILLEGNGFTGNGYPIYAAYTDGLIVCGNRADFPHATSDFVLEAGLSGASYHDNTTSTGVALRGSNQDSQPFTTTVTGINAKQVGTRSLLTVPPGRQYYVTSLAIETTAINAPGSPAVFSLGDGVTYSNVLPNTILMNTGVSPNTYVSFTPKQNAAALPGGSVLTFRINTAISGTQQTLSVHVTGFFR